MATGVPGYGNEHRKIGDDDAEDEGGRKVHFCWELGNWGIEEFGNHNNSIPQFPNSPIPIHCCVLSKGKNRR